MRRLFSLVALLVATALLYAQAPSDYYNAASGKKAAALRMALFQIIGSHTERSYADLWEDFKSTDVRPDGSIWDMYSNITAYVPGGSAQGKNYSKEGDAYNREHSFPKSWFDNAKPMYSDLMHLIPTDGYVNGRRSNYPYGETSRPTWTSSNSYSKLGPCSLAGYSGTVFEPNDEYKGDLARIYFYMATAYADRIATWSSEMLSGNAERPYTEWAMKMLLRWAQNDPVSQKEIDRNNAVFSIQHNRNPFVDFPGLEQYIWGNSTDTAFDPAHYEGATSGGEGGGEEEQVSAPVFSQEGGVVKEGFVLTITCATPAAQIHYSVDGAPEEVGLSPVTLVIHTTQTITAYASVGIATSAVSKYRFIVDKGQPLGENIYTLVEDVSQLVENGGVLVVCTAKQTALGAPMGDVREAASVSIADGLIQTEVSTNSKPYLLTLYRRNGHWEMWDDAQKVWLGLTGSANKLHGLDEESAETEWTISISDDATAMISPVVESRSNRHIQYNPSSPRFACYTGSQQEVNLYRSANSTEIHALTLDAEGLALPVYDLQGRCLGTSLHTLPAGLYVVGGKKILKR